MGPNASVRLYQSSVLEEMQVPDIATVATNPKVTVNDDGSVKPFNFRVCFIDPYQVRWLPGTPTIYSVSGRQPFCMMADDYSGAYRVL